MANENSKIIEEHRTKSALNYEPHLAMGKMQKKMLNTQDNFGAHKQMIGYDSIPSEASHFKDKMAYMHEERKSSYPSNHSNNYFRMMEVLSQTNRPKFD